MAITAAHETPLSLRLFGPMQARVQGQPLPSVRSRKALWLLALLALRHGRRVEREWFAGALWPDLDQSQAFANLRPVLSELRRALGSEGARLRSPDRGTLSLDLEGAEVDVVAFDAAIESRHPSRLEEAVALYHGPLLEGCNEEWVYQERDSRERSCLQALQQLADAAFDAGDPVAAVGYHQRAVSIAPLSDPVRRGLMNALARAGNRNAALQAYRAFEEILNRQLRQAPHDKTTALYRRLRTEERVQTEGSVQTEGRVQVLASAGIAEAARTVRARADLQAAPRVAGYLPHPVTDLVGREDERDEVADRLRRSRLITLTGVGGIGKTRLAIAVAGDVVNEFPDGVWLVTLESLIEGHRVPQQIASVLGLREEAGQPWLRSLADHLRPKRLLLVLDNCEHLLEAAAQVAAHLLRECAHLRILATSREALGITGETAWAMPTLAAPDPAHLPQGHAPLQAVLSAYDSVRLFVERAQAIHKAFDLTASNARWVAEVCFRLEGIPLAIELAAARTKVMSVEQLVARLHDHLGLLTGGSRTALSRQRTLRATLDWSYVLLSERERLLLSRLSVFTAGWTLPAAEEVCACPDIERERVSELLASLVDRSLVVFDGRDGDGRYRMLEMVRQYAAERRAVSGEAERIQARHRDWAMALAEAAEPHWSGPDQDAWLRRLDAEHENLRASLDGVGTSEPEGATGLRLAAALGPYWHRRGYYSEGRHYLARALARSPAAQDPATRAKALFEAGTLAYSQSDYAAARAFFEESLGLYEQEANRTSVGQLLASLGNVLYEQGDFRAALERYEESLTISRDLGDPRSIAWSLGNLGKVAHAHGESGGARERFEEALSLFREIGDKRATVWALNMLGSVVSEQGDLLRARACYEESPRLSREMDSTPDIAWSLNSLGNLAHSQGDAAAAERLLEESLALFRELGERRGIAWSLRCLGDVAYSRGDVPAARSLYEEGLGLRRQLGERRGTAWALNRLGIATHDLGDPITGRALLEESLGIFGELGDPRGQAESLEGLARVMQEQSDGHRAVRLWGAAHALRQRIGALANSQRLQYDRALDRARSALGHATFGALWDEGGAMTTEDAVAFALERVSQIDLNAHGR